VGQDGEALYLSQVLRPEALERDVESALSRIRIYRSGSVRCLSFVWDDGQEAVQSCVDLSRPWELPLGYLRQMTLAHKLAGVVRRALLVGLGGGSLVHHYGKYYPGVELDVVEIDPIVIALGHQLFGVPTRTRVFRADACEFVRLYSAPYDVAYVDAFLKPSALTTSSGYAACIQEPAFIGALRARLRPGGAAAFNCHHGDGNIQVIRRTFPASYVLPARGAEVVIGVREP
jgi:spermidine synthase